MKSADRRRLCRVALSTLAGGLFLLSEPAGLWAQGPAPGAQLDWQVVVNNGVTVPGDLRKFNSYNQPSVNADGLVVFRARSKGGMSGEPAHGVYTRDMALGTDVTRLLDRHTEVPHPNNLGTTFVEPPSFPRIDLWSNTIATRGNHPPVWTYLLPDGTETRAGTTGIYTNPFEETIAGASNLGAVPDFGFFAVPDAGALKFDVFPGAPAVSAVATIVFKGNYTVGTVGHTGVYYRDLADAPAGGAAPAVLIANTETLIPGTATPFGSTAPPSAVARTAVFSGFDNEEHPTKGGIYLAPLDGPAPLLTALIQFGGPVPGEAKGTVFNKLGEGLSFDGRFVAFWGAWGAETRTLILQCPEEGNAQRVAFCKQQHPSGYETAVPVHQGIFVHDIKTGRTRAVAKAPTNFDDFIYWNFSGLVPGMGSPHEAGEPARWRFATFVAVSGLVDGRLTDAAFHTAFKARRGSADGIYLRKGPGGPPFATLIETGMDGTLFDPAAFDPLTQAPLPITGMGIERDGFRGRWLVITAGMGTEEAGWAGIYLTALQEP